MSMAKWMFRCGKFNYIVISKFFTRLSFSRGRRQYLHHPRLEEVRKLWLNHAIPTLIARRLESTVDNGGWETL